MRKLQKNFKPLPIGVDDFQEIIIQGYYYVDKTLLIKELLDLKGKVNLFTRPRRFGKTLNLSMLRYFFEDTMEQEKNEKNQGLFVGLNIMQAGEKYRQSSCSFPVIYFTWKSAKQSTFSSAYAQMVYEISREFIRHNYLLESSCLMKGEKQKFLDIIERKAGYDDYACSLEFLSNCLHRHTGRKVIILMDEYDVPLEGAYSRGFYQEMTDFVRSLFESALKDNLSLEFAVLTGCLRISKESIFTGLNNLKVISIRNREYSEHFGFLEQEVKVMLEYYGMGLRYMDVKEWYNGYYFGDSNLYNPWSVINFVSSFVSFPDTRPEPYWANTSANAIIKEVLVRTDKRTKEQIERLIHGETIVIQVKEEVTYEDIGKSNYKKENKNNDFWNFLFLTGYLTKVREFQKGELTKEEEQRLGMISRNAIYLEVKIPNREVEFIYENTISEWFEEVAAGSREELYIATIQADVNKMKEIIEHVLMQSISFYDSAEAFYHGFMLGLFQNWDDYKIKSNRESGIGRSDLIFYPENIEAPAIIMELKYVKKRKEILPVCEEALKQIEDRKYDYEFVEDGYHVIKYGICFCGKSCFVKVKK